jgi:hypothetical protein
MGKIIAEVNRPQLLTIDDFEKFKVDLIDEVVKLLSTKYSPKRHWLKTREVLKLLGVSPGKLQYLRKSKKLPFTKLGGDIFYDVADIEAMMDNYKSK